jgi:hypothetical protein
MTWSLRITDHASHMVYSQQAVNSCGIASVIMINFKMKKVAICSCGGDIAHALSCRTLVWTGLARNRQVSFWIILPMTNQSGHPLRRKRRRQSPRGTLGCSQEVLVCRRCQGSRTVCSVDSEHGGGGGCAWCKPKVIQAKAIGANTSCTCTCPCTGEWRGRLRLRCAALGRLRAYSKGLNTALKSPRKPLGI